MTGALSYGELLLGIMRHEAQWAWLFGWERFFEVCDRFEGVMAHVAGAPLVWDGDYA